MPESPEEPSENLLRTVREQTRKIQLTMSPSVLDPEGDDQESSVVHFKKIVSTLITQNQQLRQSQQDAMKREEELKNQITQSQRSIENKLNRITTALEKMNGLGAVEAMILPEAPSPPEKKQEWVGVRPAPTRRK
eukprot:UN26066